MTLQFNYFSEDFATAPQLSPEHLREVAAAGFRSVLGNRPDHEGGPQQPTSESLRAAAEAAGLVYAFHPVHPVNITPQDVQEFSRLLERLPKPVLAFCRTGTRSGKLYRAAFGASS